MNTFGRRLELALKNKNMKNSVLAYRLNVDRSYITNYIKGKYVARPDTIEKMANILGVSAAWLNGYDVPMTDKLDTAENTVGLETKEIEPLKNEIVYHRNGKTVKKQFTKEQMKMLLAMIDAVSKEDE